MANRISKSTLIGISGLYLFVSIGLLALGGAIQGNLGYFPPTVGMLSAALLLIAGIAYFSKSLVSAYLLSAVLAVGLMMSSITSLGGENTAFSATLTLFAALWLGILLMPVLFFKRNQGEIPVDESLAKSLFGLPKAPRVPQKTAKAANE